MFHEHVQRLCLRDQRDFRLEPDYNISAYCLWFTKIKCFYDRQARTCASSQRGVFQNIAYHHIDEPTNAQNTRVLL